MVTNLGAAMAEPVQNLQSALPKINFTKFMRENYKKGLSICLFCSVKGFNQNNKLKAIMMGKSQQMRKRMTTYKNIH